MIDLEPWLIDDAAWERTLDGLPQSERGEWGRRLLGMEEL